MYPVRYGTLTNISAGLRPILSDIQPAIGPPKIAPMYPRAYDIQRHAFESQTCSFMGCVLTYIMTVHNIIMLCHKERTFMEI